MIRDVEIGGHTAEIVKDIVSERKIFPSNADFYFLSAMVGLFDSKDREKDAEIKSEKHSIHVGSRTFLGKRPVFNNLLYTFTKMEQKMLGEPFSINEIFLQDLPQNEDFEKEIDGILKNHAEYGIHKFYDKFQFENDKDDYDIINTISKELKTTGEIDSEIENMEFRMEENMNFEKLLDNDSF